MSVISVMDIDLRPAEPDDEAFLFELYESTRSEELAAWGFSAAQRESFLKLQFLGQQQHYRMNYPGADHKIILVGRDRAGRIMVFTTAREIRLADISLLPGYRSRGIGARLIRGLFDHATATGKPITLHVAVSNSGAIRLYKRLGFSTADNTGMHLRMEWRPVA
jgi:ribosomal protein S18 acetylase RimI-like enzyme